MILCLFQVTMPIILHRLHASMPVTILTSFNGPPFKPPVKKKTILMLWCPIGIENLGLSFSQGTPGNDLGYLPPKDKI